MVVTAPRAGAALEVRTVDRDAIDEILPLLADLRNPHMGRADWQRMLFGYPWLPDRPHTGFALYDGSKAVGFLGTIFSERRVAGRVERFCNTSCWVVQKAYRHASVLLLKNVLAMRDHTVVNLTPTAASQLIFAKLGFAPLDPVQLLIPPLPSPTRDPSVVRPASLTTSPREIERFLSGDELRLFHDAASSPQVRHVLLRAGDEHSYVIATKRHVKRVPFAEVLYVGHRPLFWKSRLLVHAAFAATLGAPNLAVDRRFAREAPHLVAVRKPVGRLYRPSRPEITPELVDGLYSELVALRT